MNPKVKNQRQNKSNALLELMRTMWNQTQPLFNREHMRTTILICTIQFWIFVTSNGMYMWFPHILNSVAEFQKDDPNGRVYICEVVYQKQESIFKLEAAMAESNSNGLAAAITEECNEKLEISTYENSLVLEVLYAVGFALIGVIINRVGKQIILCKYKCLLICN